MEDGSLVLKIYRSQTAVLKELAARVPDGLGEDERKAQRILKKLREADLIQRQGRGPSTAYTLVQS